MEQVDHRTGAEAFVEDSSPELQRVLASVLSRTSSGSGSHGNPFVQVAASGFVGLDVTPPAESPYDAASISQRLALLRRWFSLSVAEAARVLHVGRPTIYAWQSGNVPKDENQARLQQLFELGRMWREMSTEPVGKRRKLQVAGTCLVDALNEEQLDRDQIRQLLRTLAETRSKKPESAAELAERLGFEALPAREQRANIERETRTIVQGD